MDDGLGSDDPNAAGDGVGLGVGPAAAVACARVDGYFERGLKPWDPAAGSLVAREAGAVVQGLDGRAASEALVIAAGPALFPLLHDLLAPFRPDAD